MDQKKSSGQKIKKKREALLIDLGLATSVILPGLGTPQIELSNTDGKRVTG